MVPGGRARTAVALVVCLGLGSALLAQRGGAPSRAAIIGVVIDQLTGAAVEDVVVEARNGSFFDVASTDAAGRFVLSGNFPAFVAVTATSYNRGAIVHGSGAYGQTTWDGDPQQIAISPGQLLKNITIPFWRAAIVSGRVTDNEGGPVSGARVHVLDRGAESGRRMFVDTSRMDGILTFTDDDGRYRFLHRPGAVYLRVSSAELRTPAPSETGRVRALAFRPLFAPGVASSADAQPILLDPAREHVVNVVLRREPSFSVEGVVSDESGPVWGALVSWAEAGTPDFGNRFTTSTNNYGRFSIHGLVAGEYTLTAKTRWNTETRKSKSARYRVSVVDRSLIVAVNLRTEPVVSGRYVFAGSSQAPATVPSDFGVETHPALWFWYWERWRLLDEPKPRPTTFAIDVEPGRRVFSLRGAPDGWMLRSITLGQRDITHMPLDVSADLSNLVVTLIDRVTEVRGHVTGAVDSGGSSEGIWIFPADSNRWVDFGPAPPNIRRIWIDDSGDFSEKGLGPGDYLIAPLPSRVNGAPPDANVLRAASAGATRVSLADGQRVAVSLTSVPFRPGSTGPNAWVVDGLPPTRAEVPAVLARADSPLRGSTIRGQVFLAPQARPSPNTVVHLIPWPTSSQFTEYVAVQAAGLAGSLAMVDADGRFTFERVAPGPYTLTATNSGFGLASYPPTQTSAEPSVVVRAGAVTPEVQVLLTPTAKLSIVARDEEGRPIAGVNVRINPNMSILGSWISRLTAKTNDRGECFFLGLEPGSYDVSVSAYREPRRVTIAADFDDPLRLTLPRFRGSDSVDVDFERVALKPGEQRALSVVLPLGLERK